MNTAIRIPDFDTAPTGAFNTSEDDVTRKSENRMVFAVGLDIKPDPIMTGLRVIESCNLTLITNHRYPTVHWMRSAEDISSDLEQGRIRKMLRYAEHIAEGLNDTYGGQVEGEDEGFGIINALRGATRQVRDAFQSLTFPILPAKHGAVRKAESVLTTLTDMELEKVKEFALARIEEALTGPNESARRAYLTERILVANQMIRNESLDGKRLELVLSNAIEQMHHIAVQGRRACERKARQLVALMEQGKKEGADKRDRLVYEALGESLPMRSRNLHFEKQADQHASRACSACGEMILAWAKKCKHCGEWETSSGSVVTEVKPTANAQSLNSVIERLEGTEEESGPIHGEFEELAQSYSQPPRLRGRPRKE